MADHTADTPTAETKSSPAVSVADHTADTPTAETKSSPAVSVADHTADTPTAETQSSPAVLKSSQSSPTVVESSVLVLDHIAGGRSAAGSDMYGLCGAVAEGDSDMEADSVDDPDYSPESSPVSEDDDESEVECVSAPPLKKVRKSIGRIVHDFCEDVDSIDSIVPSSCINDESTTMMVPDMSRHLPHSDHRVGEMIAPINQCGEETSQPVIESTVSENELINDDSVAGKDSGQIAHKTAGSDRPSRPCPFCSQFKVRLTRHIRSKHKSEDSVKRALLGGVREQRRVFKEQKRAGIMKYNLSVMGLRDGKMQRERAPGMKKKKDDVVVCDNCQGVFSPGWFASHSKICIGDACVEPHAVPAEVFYSSLDVPQDFKMEILSHFHQDNVGKLCQSDEIITMIGSKLYTKVKRRQDKKLEVRKSVMASMRKLASLFMHFKAEWQKHADVQNTANSETSSIPAIPQVIDMFHRRNYYILEQACIAYTSRANDSDLGDKSGLMIAVYYLLIDAAKKIKVHYMVLEDNSRAKDAAEFLDVLAFNKHSLIGGATYNSNKNRQTRLRRTQNLPKEEDLGKLRAYTVDRISCIVRDEYLQWTMTEFLELRDLACSRLTLFNARRGGEPARLHLCDWVDACNKVWFNPTKVQELVAEEQSLVDDSTMIMYQTGKGVNHLVPVLVPADTVEALKKLASAVQRQLVGIPEANPYLFPSKSKADSHVSGWHAIARVTVKAGVPERAITATKMRHLTSTMYAALDIPESQRSAFYRHMGHSKIINQNIYQAPIAELEISHVGAVLKKFGESAIV